MNKKRIMLSILIGVICIGLVGVTYAAFTYSRVGTTNSKQIVGDIYMHYRENNVLTLENAMPSNTYDSSKYFEFTVDGKNTYTKKDIYYEIDLTHGDNPNIEGRTIRLNDKFLKFRLVEVINNEEVEKFTNKSYNDLTNKRIHVETIPKNTTSEITKTYRIYMWIDNNLRIGNNNADYSVEDWNKIYASIKVNVSGDFEEKSLATPASCFTTSDNGNNTVTVTGYEHSSYVVNSNMTSGELQTCVNYLTSEWGVEEEGSTVDVGETYQAFCNGTGTLWGGTFQEYIDDVSFGSEDLEYLVEENIIQLELAPSYCTSDVIIPSTINNKTVTTIGDSAFYNNQLTSVVIGNSVTTIENHAFQSNQLTSVEIPNSVTTIDSWAFSSNQLTSVEIPNSVETIGSYAFDWNQLTSVEIPNSVTTIGMNAFSNNQLTSVVISNSVTTIGRGAFLANQLTSVEIPNSVTTIGDSAFYGNQLTSVTIGNGITSIGSESFNKSSESNLNLASITINKSCNDIKNSLNSNNYNNINYYPWLSSGSPYRGIGGVTIYGSNNEVCDAF